ncbi:DUF3883 domain-containing protein [Roseateles sp. So40a]|uniref:DUF3883 domain-containing protein n=1 Tax=Roseateles sp. So40a TaxID=3400226 RepID=UPI003A8B2C77
MASDLSRIDRRASVQAALDEFVSLGRAAFLAKYGFGKSRDFLVLDPTTGTPCDSKAIAGAAFGHQFPDEGPLEAADFSGGEATVVPTLERLGFQVVRIGEDWNDAEVTATVDSYFEMLRLEALGHPFRKTEFNEALRARLRGRSKASVELKFQNISAVLWALELPFINGYKPRGNSQLLLRQVVQKFLSDQQSLIRQIADAFEEVRTPDQQGFHARVVDPPSVQMVDRSGEAATKLRLPRHVDFAARDEANRRLGRAGEQWAIGYEHIRLHREGLEDLVQSLKWVSEDLGDGAGYDIESFDAPGAPRLIEVKTTNRGHASSFSISRNELEVSREREDAYCLYRIFNFREQPSLYVLRGDMTKHLHLQPIDFRASFKRFIGE